MEMPGGSGGAALARQGSIYSLTFDEFQSALGGAGKDFGSMNMDELLRNIWTAEESNAMAAAAPPTGANAVDAQAQQGVLRQGSMTLPRTLSQMTVDEVWRDIMGFCDDDDQPPPAPPAPQAHPQSQAQAQAQSTLGAMTLEEFLVRAGVVREDMGGQTVVVPARTQALFPPSQGNAVAQTMQLGNNGVVGGMTVAAPTTPVVLNGFAKMEGDDLSSLSPVPYPFDSAMRARKAPTVEKVVERRQRRMIKNRESAARSRQRKQAYIMELEAEVAKLKENNEELQKKQMEVLQKQKNEVIERIEQQLGPKAKRFCLRRTLTGPW